MNVRLTRVLRIAAMSLALSNPALWLCAQATPQITGAVNSAVRTLRIASVPVQVQSSTDLGRVDAALPMKDMLLRLKPSAQQAQAAVSFPCRRAESSFAKLPQVGDARRSSAAVSE